MNKVTKMIATIVVIHLVTNVNAQTLFTYGKKQVTKAEFLKAFNKNNSEATPTQQVLKEYLDLYTKFKIKVQAALDARLDTLPNQKSELSNFRLQVANSYMNDEASTNLLIEEAFTRAAKDVQLAHIFIPFNPAEQEQKSAIDNITKAYDRLQKGEDFGKVAVEFSKDPAVAVNKGVIGYITCFLLPYELENIAYNTAVGKFSKPYKSGIGYHIFKNIGERKSVGRMRAAQILLSFPPGATTIQKQQLAQKADSIYAALLKGADFKEMALNFSNDNMSYQNGGELQEFGTGQYDPEFESKVFAIKNDGEIAPAFQTSFGYHIVKRIQLKQIDLDRNNKTIWENMKQQVLQSDRMELSKNTLLKKIQQQTAIKKLPINQAALNRLADSVLGSKKHLYTGGIKPSTVLFSFPKQNITVNDYVSYLDAMRGTPMAENRKSNVEMMTRFTESSAVEYYKEHLEEYNKDFAYQLNEFKEGNLLFEIMQRKIWDAASADTTGLKKYYESNKSRYWWEASADAWVITATNDSIAKQIISQHKLGSSVIDYRKLIQESDGSLQGDSGRFELTQLPVLDSKKLSQGMITEPVKNETDNSVTFCYIVKINNNREPRAFEDAKGFVINDYQNYLDENWVKELKKKYPVRIDEKVFGSLIPKSK